MSVLTPAITCAAFWLAIALHACRDPSATRRFALALAGGAGAAHLLCALLFQHGAAAPLGASILLLPLGPLACLRRPAAFECLPLPLALARLGCVASGCCRGSAGEPLPLFEGAALVGLHAGLRSLPAGARPGGFLLAFGLLRVAETPWRPGPEGALVAPAVVALTWMLVGVVWIARSEAVR